MGFHSFKYLHSKIPKILTSCTPIFNLKKIMYPLKNVILFKLIIKKER